MLHPSPNFNARVRSPRPKWPWALAVFVVSEAIQIGGAVDHWIAQILFAFAAILVLWDVTPRLRDHFVGWKYPAVLVLTVLFLTIGTYGACLYLAPPPDSGVNVVQRILDGVDELFKKYVGAKQSVDAKDQMPSVDAKDQMPSGDADNARGTQGIAVDTLEMELAPIVLVHRSEAKFSGENHPVTFYHYGLAAVLRVTHSGSDVHYVRQLEVSGDVPLLQSDYTLITKEGVNIFEAGEAIAARKPYRTLSWNTYPSGDNKVDVSGDEKFLRFLIVEPYESVRMTSHGPGHLDESHWGEYVGYQDTRTKPKALTRVPYIYDLVEPIGVNPNGQQGPWRLLPEVQSGSVRFQVKTNTGAIAITPASIRKPQWVFRSEWDKVTPQELFFRMEHLLRGIPLGSDPLAR